MDDRIAFENIRSATILKPGDRVLVDVGERATMKQVHTLAEQLKGRLPDVNFLVLAGVNSVAVVPSVGEQDQVLREQLADLLAARSVRVEEEAADHG